MSLKPLKKSDLGKDWVKGRKSKRVRLQPEYHLIVTEGTDTEPRYFEAIKKSINEKFRDHIQLVIEGVGDNTLSLFEKARQEAYNSANEYKHVWIVYDTDDFPAEHINYMVVLCEKASTEDMTFHAVWSNQCIELWFLLHFGFYQSDIHRSEYWDKLSGYLKSMGYGDYAKNREDMYFILRPFMDAAIHNAKRLDEINTGKLPAIAAPGTKVYELIEKLKPYL